MTADGPNWISEDGRYYIRGYAHYYSPTSPIDIMLVVYELTYGDLIPLPKGIRYDVVVSFTREYPDYGVYNNKMYVFGGVS